jgi:hypothetical protein
MRCLDQCTATCVVLVDDQLLKKELGVQVLKAEIDE